ERLEEVHQVLHGGAVGVAAGGVGGADLEGAVRQGGSALGSAGEGDHVAGLEEQVARGVVDGVEVGSGVGGGGGGGVGVEGLGGEDGALGGDVAAGVEIA